MTERTSNILKALFCAFVALGCIYVKFFGVKSILVDPNSSFPYIGAVLGVFLCISFLRKAFEK